MELHEIPTAFQTRLRTAIMSALVTGEKTFGELKKIVQATDGNVSIQAAALEEAGYIVSRKEIIRKRPCTTYTITESGRAAFLEYVALLESILKNAENQK